MYSSRCTMCARLSSTRSIRKGWKGKDASTPRSWPRTSPASCSRRQGRQGGGRGCGEGVGWGERCGYEARQGREGWRGREGHSLPGHLQLRQKQAPNAQIHGLADAVGEAVDEGVQPGLQVGGAQAADHPASGSSGHASQWQSKMASRWQSNNRGWRGSPGHGNSRQRWQGCCSRHSLAGHTFDHSLLGSALPPPPAPHLQCARGGGGQLVRPRLVGACGAHPSSLPVPWGV